MIRDTTCILTPEIACAFAEEYAEGKSLTQIAAELRAECRMCGWGEDDHPQKACTKFEAHRVWPADVTWWCRGNREVDIAGEKIGFNDLLTGVYPRRKHDLLWKMIDIADTAAERGEDPRRTQHRINARKWYLELMEPKYIGMDDSSAWGVVPENDGLFPDDASTVN